VSPAARASALKTKRRHRWLGILLLVALVPISSVNLAGQIFLKDADQKIAEVCEAEKTALDCQRLAVNPGQAYQDKLLVGGGTMQIWNDLWWLNVFELFVSTGDIDKVYLRDTIEDQFFEAVWAAHLVETRFVSFYISFLGSLLPLIYALLGAVAFGIRDLRRRVADNTWTVAQELSATLRLLLAFFVGVVIGLFGDWTRGTSLSPIAIAFLAGYGVESFFDFLDGSSKPTHLTGKRADQPDFSNSSSLNTAAKPASEEVPATDQQVAAISPDQQPQPQPIPAPEPTEPKAQAGGYLAQLASFRSEADAMAEFNRLRVKYGDLVGSLSPRVTKASVSGTTRYRLGVGPVASREAAARICNSLIAAGERDCLVRGN